MTKQEWRAFLSAGPVLLDGATGSNLREMGLGKEDVTELWALRHPEAVLKLQEAFRKAGSQILYAPTFQAQPAALEKAGWQGRAEDLNASLVKLTRDAAGDQCLVAGDISTMAGTLPSWDEELFDTLVEEYRHQISGLLKGGVDLLVAETLMYPQEAEAVLTAAELEGGGVPVMVSFTMQPDGSFFSGRDAAPVLREMELAGADAVGFNCVAASGQLPALVSRLRRYVRGPLISKPNAGDPVVRESGKVDYPMGAEAFADLQCQAAQMGANLLGGCCGTTPEFIAVLRNRLGAMGKY